MMQNNLIKHHFYPFKLFVAALTVIVVGHFFNSVKSTGAEGISPPQRLNFELLTGEWLRTDGGYLIRVSNIKTNGQVKAEYFNPKPINVAEATVSTQKNMMKLFIKLQDKGYPGSTYTLYYYSEKDVLVGFYYQAAMDKTFEVVFFRKKVE